MMWGFHPPRARRAVVRRGWSVRAHAGSGTAHARAGMTRGGSRARRQRVIVARTDIKRVVHARRYEVGDSRACGQWVIHACVDMKRGS